MDICGRLSAAMEPLEELVRHPTGFQQAVKTWVLLRDARDEIEQLRAACRQIIDQEEISEARAIASQALFRRAIV